MGLSNRLRKLTLRDQRGQVIILAGILLPTFIGLGALTVDVGGWYTQHSKAQKAADAAALAAARYLPNAPDSARAAAVNSVAVNLPGASANPPPNIYCDSHDLQCDPSHPKDIKVTVHTSSGSYLARIFGFSTVSVNASAVATRAEQLKPVGLFAGAPGGTVCNNVFQVSGGNLHVDGGIISNGGIHISGQNAYSDSTTFYQGCSGNVDVTANSNLNGPGSGPQPNADPIREQWPVNDSAGDFTCDFSAAKFPRKILDDWSAGATIVPGVYCATDSIQISNEYVSGNVTFISPKIQISGKCTAFTPYATDPDGNEVLFLATGTAGVQWSGSSDGCADGFGCWEGFILAQQGQAQVSGGGGCVYNGFVEALNIQVSGQDMHLNSTGPLVPIGVVKLID